MNGDLPSNFIKNDHETINDDQYIVYCQDKEVKTTNRKLINAERRLIIKKI